jgi:hypothetical protein
MIVVAVGPIVVENSGDDEFPPYIPLPTTAASSACSFSKISPSGTHESLSSSFPKSNTKVFEVRVVKKCSKIEATASTTTAGVVGGSDCVAESDADAKPTCKFSCAAGYEFATGVSDTITCDDGVWPSNPACVGEQRL